MEPFLVIVRVSLGLEYASLVSAINCFYLLFSVLFFTCASKFDQALSALLISNPPTKNAQHNFIERAPLGNAPKWSYPIKNNELHWSDECPHSTERKTATATGIFMASKEKHQPWHYISHSPKIGDRQPRTIPTKDLHQMVFLGGVVCEFLEPKKKAKYAPPLVLHSRCWSSILWGWCVDFGVRPRICEVSCNNYEKISPQIVLCSMAIQKEGLRLPGFFKDKQSTQTH